MRRPSLQHELRKKRPFDAPEVEAHLNIVRTAAALGAEPARILREAGLSGPAYNVLRILRGHHPAGLPSQAIGAQMVTLVPDVTRLVDRLEAAGLAQRARTEQDRRVVLVRITKAGLDLLARLDRPIEEAHKKQLGHLSRRELAELSRLLVKARYPEGAPPGPGALAPPPPAAPAARRRGGGAEYPRRNPR